MSPRQERRRTCPFDQPLHPRHIIPVERHVRQPACTSTTSLKTSLESNVWTEVHFFTSSHYNSHSLSGLYPEKLEIIHTHQRTSPQFNHKDHQLHFTCMRRHILLNYWRWRFNSISSCEDLHANAHTIDDELCWGYVLCLTEKCNRQTHDVNKVIRYVHMSSTNLKCVR